MNGEMTKRRPEVSKKTYNHDVKYNELNHCEDIHEAIQETGEIGEICFGIWDGIGGSANKGIEYTTKAGAEMLQNVRMCTKQRDKDSR